MTHKHTFGARLLDAVAKMGRPAYVSVRIDMSGYIIRVGSVGEDGIHLAEAGVSDGHEHHVYSVVEEFLKYVSSSFLPLTAERAQISTSVSRISESGVEL